MVPKSVCVGGGLCQTVKVKSRHKTEPSVVF